MARSLDGTFVGHLQALKNCDAILRAAGSSMDKVVNATIILRYAEDFAGMNEEWTRGKQDAWKPAVRPASAP